MQNILSFANNLDEYLDDLLSIKNYPCSKLAESMRYSVLGGGKRIRPYFLYVLSLSLGGNIKDILLIGSTIEMIHAYTLIHDDLPAMDDDDIRRGKPSNHKFFNEATAILAGDALQSEAFYYLSSNNLQLDNDVKINIINAFAEYLGGRNLISGQSLDVDFQETTAISTNIKNMETINLLKTAKFFILICKIISCINRLNEETTKQLLQYGEKIGLMFQLIDDIDDYNSASANMVKYLGIDESMRILNVLNKESLQILEDLHITEVSVINNILMEKYNV
jgi:geranylgeranyl pyrophosphate synthase